MHKKIAALQIAVLFLFLWPTRTIAEVLPTIPVGLDAYRQWERWPYQRIGARAYMRSTYDRAGGNETADASHFLYQERDDFNVALDVEGKGVLYFVRTNHWHGSPWHYEVDGDDFIVQETTTADPTKKLDHSVFIPEDLFPNPLTWTYSITKGADLMWVPISFEKSFRLAYSRTFYGTGYYIYHHYLEGAPLSQPVETWKRLPPDPEVLELLNRAGTDIAPKPGTEEGEKVGIQEVSGSVTLNSKSSSTLIELEDAPSTIRAIKISVPREKATAFGKGKIRMTWDGSEHSSVEAPIDLFFGAGTLHNRDNKEYLVKALPVNIRFDDEKVYLNCYFPMPFHKSAKIELVGPEAERVEDIGWSVRYQPYEDPANQVGYFHATYVDHATPEQHKDLVFLDTSLVEGGGDWSGSFIGTSFIFSDRAVLNTLEGDPRFFFDDSQTPQAYGTGTEEWGGGGDYWGGLNMTLPLAGHPVGVRKPEDAKSEEDLIQSAYRFLLADLMPFGKRALIRFEHGGHNDSKEHYRSVTYWYGVNAPSLVMTDELNVGDPASEKDHDYDSPDASDSYNLTSRYEWGVDEGFSPVTQTGRTTTSHSEFTLELIPENEGVLLRRTLDYQYPNQRAMVHVESENGEWVEAGVWYLAGSNTCYHSYPKGEGGGELAPSSPVVQTSNRRFRDDEFLVPRHLTKGRDSVRFRIEFTPVERPLLPGGEIPELAWSEFNYKCYCLILPTFEVN
ncbi:MAG: DUF2961 domain-containing protein [Candidatus Omnitrophica bacterium]|nr:DUF2961 domain-containing protein [Candidatus Omnitrophota bacterium]